MRLQDVGLLLTQQPHQGRNPAGSPERARTAEHVVIEREMTDAGRVERVREAAFTRTDDGRDVVSARLQLAQHLDEPRCATRRAAQVQKTHVYGTIANARAGKPRPSCTFGQVTTMSAPVGGT